MKTNHTIQVAAFGKLVGFCNAHGEMYKPVKGSLTVAALNSLLTSAQQSLEAANQLETAFHIAVSTRRDAFDALSKLMTRIGNALEPCSVLPATHGEVMRYARRFRRMTKSDTAAPQHEGVPPDPPVARGVSHFDFSSRLKNLEALINVLRADPAYAPQEPALTIEAFNAIKDRLKQLNESVSTAYVAQRIARDLRDQHLYSESGIHGTARQVKMYLKAAFGYESDAYDQVKGLRFKKASS